MSRRGDTDGFISFRIMLILIQSTRSVLRGGETLGLTCLVHTTTYQAPFSALNNTPRSFKCYSEREIRSTGDFRA